MTERSRSNRHTPLWETARWRVAQCCVQCRSGRSRSQRRHQRPRTTARRDEIKSHPIFESFRLLARACTPVQWTWSVEPGLLSHGKPEALPRRHGTNSHCPTHERLPVNFEALGITRVMNIPFSYLQTPCPSSECDIYLQRRDADQCCGKSLHLQLERFLTASCEQV